jgi:hypothetical protein
MIFPFRAILLSLIPICPSAPAKITRLRDGYGGISQPHPLLLPLLQAPLVAPNRSSVLCDSTILRYFQLRIRSPHLGDARIYAGYVAAIP